MFGSLLKLTENVVKVAAAPIEVVADVAVVVTQPLADAAEEVTSSVKEGLDDAM